MDEDITYQKRKEKAFDVASYWGNRGGDSSFDLFSVRYITSMFADYNVIAIALFNFEFRFYIKK